MLLKKQITEAEENMPNESSTEDLIEQGITDVQQNNVVNEDKIDYLIDEWSK